MRRTAGFIVLFLFLSMLPVSAGDMKLTVIINPEEVRDCVRWGFFPDDMMHPMVLGWEQKLCTKKSGQSMDFEKSGTVYFLDVEGLITPWSVHVTPGIKSEVVEIQYGFKWIHNANTSRDSDVQALEIWGLLDERLRLEYSQNADWDYRQKITELLAGVAQCKIFLNCWEDDPFAIHVSLPSPGMCVPPTSIRIEDTQFTMDVMHFFNNLHKILFNKQYDGYVTMNGSCSLLAGSQPEIYFQARLANMYVNTLQKDVEFQGTIKNGKPVKYNGN
ncbi:MAG: hypothetical protein PHQ23_05540 [Candidatus Wallbacteria bacterium]|nr:hypothetical protein [Candidatus Wallbacteria bacterium]